MNAIYSDDGYERDEDWSNFSEFFRVEDRPITRVAQWKCRDGRKFAVAEMSSSHILNAVRLLTRSKLRLHVRLHRIAIHYVNDAATLQRRAYDISDRITFIERWIHIFNVELDNRGVVT